jgi:hypothetical protein
MPSSFMPRDTISNRAHRAAAAAVETSFSLAWQGAHTVCLAIFFNDWILQSARKIHFPWNGLEPRTPPLMRALVRLSEAKPAFWLCEVPLQPGWCEYLFLVDGTWVFDPYAPEKCPDGTGDFSCARWIEPAVRRREGLPFQPASVDIRRRALSKGAPS